MIELKDDKIWLYSNSFDVDNAELPTLDFELIAAYACPACSKILSAYFIGTITEEILEAYSPKDTTSYAPKYQTGTSNGGSYIKNINHGKPDYQGHTNCDYQAVNGRGIKNCLKALCDFGSLANIPDSFIQAIENDELEEFGLTLANDWCRNDEPIILYDIKKICNEHSYLEREEHLAEEITKLMQPYLKPKAQGIVAQAMRDLQAEYDKLPLQKSKIGGKKVKIQKGQTTLF